MEGAPNMDLNHFARKIMRRASARVIADPTSVAGIADMAMQNKAAQNKEPVQATTPRPKFGFSLWDRRSRAVSSRHRGSRASRESRESTDLSAHGGQECKGMLDGSKESRVTSRQSTWPRADKF